jgi:hypothetical protein
MEFGSVIGCGGIAPPMRSGWPSVNRDTHSLTRGCDESRSAFVSSGTLEGAGGGGGTRFTLGGTGSACLGPPGAFGVAERGGVVGMAGRAALADCVLGTGLGGGNGVAVGGSGRTRVSATPAASIGFACPAARRDDDITART